MTSNSDYLQDLNVYFDNDTSPGHQQQLTPTPPKLPSNFNEHQQFILNTTNASTSAFKHDEATSTTSLNFLSSFSNNSANCSISNIDHFHTNINGILGHERRAYSMQMLQNNLTASLLGIRERAGTMHAITTTSTYSTNNSISTSFQNSTNFINSCNFSTIPNKELEIAELLTQWRQQQHLSQSSSSLTSIPTINEEFIDPINDTASSSSNVASISEQIKMLQLQIAASRLQTSTNSNASEQDLLNAQLLLSTQIQNNQNLAAVQSKTSLHELNGFSPSTSQITENYAVKNHASQSSESLVLQFLYQQQQLKKQDTGILTKRPSTLNGFKSSCEKSPASSFIKTSPLKPLKEAKQRYFRSKKLSPLQNKPNEPPKTSKYVQNLTFKMPPTTPTSSSNEIVENLIKEELFVEHPASSQLITRLPYSSESCHTITKFLMNFNLSSDVEFSKKAIESLIKRLRDKRDELDYFIKVVNDKGVKDSKCVTIPRTLDGFPHVVYSRIFRWPDLHKNEIKQMPCCKAAFDMKCDLVCVNPFHYQRVMSITPPTTNPSFPTTSLSTSRSYQQWKNDDKVFESNDTTQIQENPNHFGESSNNLMEVVESEDDEIIEILSTKSSPKPNEPLNQTTPQKLRDKFFGTDSKFLNQNQQNYEIFENEKQHSQMDFMDSVSSEFGNSYAISQQNLDKITSYEQDKNVDELKMLEKLSASAAFSKLHEDFRQEEEQLIPKQDYSKDALFLENLNQMEGISLIRHFSEYNSIVNSDSISMLQENSTKENLLIQKLKIFPRTVSILVRLLNESTATSNSSTPPSSNLYIDQQVQHFLDGGIPKVDYFYSTSRRLNSTEVLMNMLSNNSAISFWKDSTFEANKETSNISNVDSQDDDKYPKNFGKKRSSANEYDVSTLEPPLKKQQTGLIEAKEKTSYKFEDYQKADVNEKLMIETDSKVPSVLTSTPMASPTQLTQLKKLCFLREIVAEIQEEMNHLFKSDQISITKKESLEPLKDVLQICLCQKDGIRSAMNILVNSIFQNINAQKMLPLIDGVTGDTPYYKISYNEFNRIICPPMSFHQQFIYCGRMPIHGEKEIFEIGTSKICPEFNGLQIQQIHDCRKIISYGISMEVTDEGEVYLRCLSKRPCYVESHYLDREALIVAGDAAHVIYQQAAIKVYDLWQSFQLMCFWITQRNILAKRNAQNAQKLITELNRLCKFRVSFGVSWGVPERATITKTPCWMEITMPRAKKLLDNLLKNPEIAYNFVFNDNSHGNFKKIKDELA